MKAFKYLLVFTTLICLFGFAGCQKEPEAPQSSADTTISDYTLSELELAVIEELNFARTQPQKYVTQRLSTLVSSKNSESYAAALDEVIDEMNRMKTPLPALTNANGLNKCAAEWVKVSGPKGTVGHESNIATRFKKYCSYATLGENCSYGYSTAKDIVAALLIDDGVETRGHRKNILSSAFTHVGVAVGSHKKYGTMCCMDFASHYQDK